MTERIRAITISAEEIVTGNVLVDRTYARFYPTDSSRPVKIEEGTQICVEYPNAVVAKREKEDKIKQFEREVHDTPRCLNNLGFFIDYYSEEIYPNPEK